MEQTEAFGTKVIEYDSIPEFLDALKGSGAKRMHTFHNAGLFGIGGQWTASFIDSKGVVHGYITHDLKEGFEDRIKPICELIKSEKIPDVDGVVGVSPLTGAVYQAFQTESPEERAQQSFEAWRDAVLELPVKGTLIQYLQDEKATIVDATRGKFHLVTTLDGEEGRDLESVLNILKPYKSRDNGKVVSWYKDLTNE